MIKKKIIITILCGGQHGSLLFVFSLTAVYIIIIYNDDDDNNNEVISSRMGATRRSGKTYAWLGRGGWLENRLSRRVIRVIGWKGADGEGNVDRNIIILYIPSIGG